MRYDRKSPQLKKRRGMYFACETCGEEFYVPPSEIRRAEKRGHKIRFCGMACYDKRGTNNPFYGQRHSDDAIRKMAEHPNRPRFKAGPENPNFTRFGEEYGFKGSRAKWWKNKLLRDIGACERCGYDDKRILTLHHMDRDRSNNTRENLQLLCWNCHALHHFEEGTGAYHFKVLNGRISESDDRRAAQARKEEATPRED